MSSTPAPAPSVAALWRDRVRFAVALAAAWALFHAVGTPLLPGGLERPPVLAAAAWGPLGALGLLLLLWIATAGVTLLSGASEIRRPLIIVGLALGLWIFERGATGGTSQQWLIAQNPQTGPPRSGPYAWLLLDYLYLIIGVAGAYAVAALLTFRGRPLQRAAGLQFTKTERRQGLKALAVTTVLGGVVVFVLCGPSLDVFRGQVYFAVGIGFFIGAAVAQRMTPARDPLWFVPAPLLVGLIGVIVAIIDPALRVPPAYRGLDILPAWGLTHPLPIEYVALGLVGALWPMRTHDDEAASQ